MNLRRLHYASLEFEATLTQLTAFENAQNPEVDRIVGEILQEVRRRGDSALLEYTSRFDGLQLESGSALELPLIVAQVALTTLEAPVRSALEFAAARIRTFHQRQQGESWQYTEADGTVLGQRVVALDRVGLYVPGGKAVYPSSVLMNAIPAAVAGVKEIVMVVPTPGGVRNQLVLAAAALSGVQRIFTIGGAQAIAALAYGTQTIPAVDKIVGPGNAYVAAAKRQVFGRVGIDMVAGPSEIMIIADGSTPPEWLAMDLFSQAEHDELAQSLLLCPDSNYLDQVAEAILRLLPAQPRQEVIRAALAGRGALVQVRDLEQACEWANRIAPEHLELSVADPAPWVARIRHAGALFVGSWSSESLGDYCAGPNHVLPTGRTARFAAPLGVYDFQKRSSLIWVSPEGARTLGACASTLARQEGLEAHARSAELRCEAR